MLILISDSITCTLHVLLYVCLIYFFIYCDLSFTPIKFCHKPSSIYLIITLWQNYLSNSIKQFILVFTVELHLYGKVHEYQYFYWTLPKEKSTNTFWFLAEIIIKNKNKMKHHNFFKSLYLNHTLWYTANLFPLILLIIIYFNIAIPHPSSHFYNWMNTTSL